MEGRGCVNRHIFCFGLTNIFLKVSCLTSVQSKKIAKVMIYDEIRKRLIELRTIPITRNILNLVRLYLMFHKVFSHTIQVRVIFHFSAMTE